MSRHHRRPPMPPGFKPRGTCQWCAGAILYPEGHKAAGQMNVRRGWHPDCVTAYRIAAFSSDQRSHVRSRDKGFCAACGVDAGRDGWEADHIRPLWSAPIDMALEDREEWFGLSNLQTLCVPCHKAKSAREAAERCGKPRLVCEVIA